MSYSIFCFCLFLLSYNAYGDPVKSFKPGTRMVLYVPKPDGAVRIESCNAEKIYSYDNNRKTLSELLDSDETRGHFINANDCTLEVVTLDRNQSEWIITTNYYDASSYQTVTESKKIKISPKIYVEHNDTLLAEVSYPVRVSLAGPPRGQKIACYAIHNNINEYDSSSSAKLEATKAMNIPGLTNTLIKVKTFIFETFDDQSCSMTLNILNTDMFGKWEFITSYIYRDDSRRLIQMNQSQIYYIEDRNKFQSYGQPLRVVSPDFDFISKSGDLKTIYATVGKNLTVTPSPLPSTVKYVERCEALFVGSGEDFIFEIAPNKDSRFDYNYRGMFETCKFEFTSFKREFFGTWYLSTYYKKYDKGIKMYRHDDPIQIFETPKY